MRWPIGGDLSKLQIKLITIIKPLICALNPALNRVNPLAASRFVIKALRAYADYICLENLLGVSFGLRQHYDKQQ